MTEPLDWKPSRFDSIRWLGRIRVDTDVVTAKFSHAKSIRPHWAPVGRHHRRHAGALHGAEIAIGEVAVLRKRLALLRPAEGDGRAMAFDQLQCLCGLESGLGDQRGAVMYHCV